LIRQIFYCNACHEFIENHGEAFAVHCCMKKHYDNHKAATRQHVTNVNRCIITQNWVKNSDPSQEVEPASSFMDGFEEITDDRNTPEIIQNVMSVQNVIIKDEVIIKEEPNDEITWRQPNDQPSMQMIEDEVDNFETPSISNTMPRSGAWTRPVLPEVPDEPVTASVSNNSIEDLPLSSSMDSNNTPFVSENNPTIGSVQVASRSLFSPVGSYENELPVPAAAREVAKAPRTPSTNFGSISSLVSSTPLPDNLIAAPVDHASGDVGFSDIFQTDLQNDNVGDSAFPGLDFDTFFNPNSDMEDFELPTAATELARPAAIVDNVPPVAEAPIPVAPSPLIQAAVTKTPEAPM
jgi:hypothetical protein